MLYLLLTHCKVSKMLIRVAGQFYIFSNVKLNHKKCEIFKLNNSDDHEIIIAET
jgi:hypothetical protein